MDYQAVNKVIKTVYLKFVYFNKCNTSELSPSMMNNK